MKTNTSKFIKAVVAGAALSVMAMPAMAQTQAKTLDELLKQIEQGNYAEAKENRQREARFRKEKAKQEELLRKAKAERSRLEKVAAQREATFEANEKKVAAAKDRLNEQKGSLTELFGHLTTASGDMVNIVATSPTSAQFPNREVEFEALITKISESDKLPTIEEMKSLWAAIHREMTESGRVVSFPATVVRPNGDEVEMNVVRVGSFNLVTEEGKYLKLNNGTLEELLRQPENLYVNWAQGVANATGGLNTFGIDPTGPTGGTLLAALINSPTIEERWHQGGYVGYAITALGVVAILIAIWRIAVLMGVSGRVNAQLKADKANPNNPLGRVLAVHEENPSMDTETLELKLNEAVLKEIPGLEAYQGALKIIAAVAPLMGLLGTVTGMIMTFQAITIFGAGDPKAMAGGISSALITTVLGLLVAIPTVLLHTMVASRSKRIIHILEEQSTGIIAEHTEAELGK